MYMCMHPDEGRLRCLRAIVGNSQPQTSVVSMQVASACAPSQRCLGLLTSIPFITRTNTLLCTCESTVSKTRLQVGFELSARQQPVQHHHIPTSQDNTHSEKLAARARKPLSIYSSTSVPTIQSRGLVTVAIPRCHSRRCHTSVPSFSRPCLSRRYRWARWHAASALDVFSSGAAYPLDAVRWCLCACSTA